MANIQFSVDDLKTPESLERVLRQFQTAVTATSVAVQKIPPAATIPTLAKQLAPLINTELQATGSAPLNLQSLFPIALATGAALQGTHATRLSTYSGSQLPGPGVLFYETDRNVLYIIKTGSPNAWHYVAGCFNAARASFPSDLGTADTGFLFYANDFAHLAQWDGTVYQLTDGGGGYFVASAIALGAGYQLCDGTVSSYITNATNNLSLTAFTTPNLTVAGIYLTSAAAYSGSVTAAGTIGVDSGPGTVVQVGVGATVATHTHTHALSGDPVANIGVIYYLRR